MDQNASMKKVEKARRRKTACQENALSLFPGVAAEQDQNGEDLQAAGQHSPGKYQGAEIGEGWEIAGGTYTLKAGTDVGKAGKGGGEVCEYAVVSGISA